MSLLEKQHSAASTLLLLPTSCDGDLVAFPGSLCSASPLQHLTRSPTQRETLLGKRPPISHTKPNPKRRTCYLNSVSKFFPWKQSQECCQAPYEGIRRRFTHHAGFVDGNNCLTDNYKLHGLLHEADK